MNNTNKIIYSVVFVGIVLSFAIYQSFVVAPRERHNDRADRLETCMEKAQEQYTNHWNSTCKSAGREEECSLPNSEAKYISSLRTDDRDRCVQLYK